MSRFNRPAFWVVCSIGLYLTASALPALQFRRNNDKIEIWLGWHALLATLLGPFVGHFEGLANVALLVAAVLLALRIRQASLICISIAMLLGMQTFLLFTQSIPADEGGVSNLTLTIVREGTFCWFGSMVVILLGGIYCPSKPKTGSSTPDPV